MPPLRAPVLPRARRRLLALALAALMALLPVAAAGEGPVVVELERGWNNVPYNGEPLPVEEALAGAAAAIESVWGWQAAEAVWLVAFPDAPEASSLRALQTGAAYWLRAEARVRWAQPASVSWERGLLAVERGEGPPLLLDVELADSPARRARGLMFRQFLEEGVGMLFLFPAGTRGGFWMRDTPAPLSIAFISAEGVITEIRDLEPLDETPVRPAAAYRWALEVNRGWFAEHGVVPGDRVRLTGR